MIQTVKIKELPVDLSNNNKFKYAVNDSSNTLIQSFASVVNPSTSFTVECNPPSASCIISPDVEISAVFNWSLAGTGVSGSNLVMPLQDAPRAFPIQNCLQTLQLALNNDKITTNVKTYFSGKN